jgi:hypothetical protein
MSSTKKQKSKLLKLMKSTEKNTYETTQEDCQRWFRVINQEVFSNKLPQIDRIDIRWRRGSHAWYECYNGSRKRYSKLNMNKKYSSKQFFVEVLAHELVHHYQFANGIPLSHGESFAEWKERFNKKGLSLQIGYKDE